MYQEQDLQRINQSIRAYDRLILQARILTVLTEKCLGMMSLKNTERLLSFFMKKEIQTNEQQSMAILDMYITVFNQINQFPDLKGRCLSQSLIMRLLLSRKGLTADLKIGVKNNSGSFDAHAWLEKDGILLNDHPSVIAKYIVLPESKKQSILTFK